MVPARKAFVIPDRTSAIRRARSSAAATFFRNLPESAISLRPIPLLVRGRFLSPCSSDAPIGFAPSAPHGWALAFRLHAGETATVTILRSPAPETPNRSRPPSKRPGHAGPRLLPTRAPAPQTLCVAAPLGCAAKPRAILCVQTATARYHSIPGVKLPKEGTITATHTSTPATVPPRAFEAK